MYKWKPNATQRRAFSERMRDPEEQLAYLERKRAKNTYSSDPRSFKNRSFVPTKMQYEIAFDMLGKELTQEQRDATNMVMSGQSCQDRVHHDYIHIINHFKD